MAAKQGSSISDGDEMRSFTFAFIITIGLSGLILLAIGCVLVTMGAQWGYVLALVGAAAVLFGGVTSARRIRGKK